MKKGRTLICLLPDNRLYDILREIQDSCIEEAGDSYAEFGREVTKLLVREGIVDYGDPLPLYHATHKSNLNDILNDGILTNPPNHNWDGMDMQEKIYLAFDPEVALDYAINSSAAEKNEWEEKDFVILQIYVDKLDQSKMSYDWNNRCEYSGDINSVAYGDVISPDCIRVFGKGSTQGLEGHVLEDYKGTEMYERIMTTFEEEVETNKERDE